MIAENIARVRETMTAACARAGRAPDAVTLIAVSKTHPASALAAAAEAGVIHFGENRVEEASTKIPQVRGDHAGLIFHMIGHLQSRKAKDVPSLFDVVHSVDTLKLAEKLSRAALDRGMPIAALVEINISGEASKSGLTAAGWTHQPEVRDALRAEITAMAGLPGLEVRGLMTMAPIVDDMEQARPVFAGLARLAGWLRDESGLALPELSMGMSDDYPAAIEEGATLIRVGRAIFGERAP